jgi:hypothetical protein
METLEKLYSENGLGLTTQYKSAEDIARFLEIAKQTFGIPNADPKSITEIEINTTIQIPDKIMVGEISRNACRTHGIWEWNDEKKQFQWKFVTLCRDSKWQVVKP